MIAPTFTGKGKFRKDRVVIPDWVECEHCTINWRWDCALEASVFSNCADITILPAGRPVPSPAPRPSDSAVSLVTSDGLCLDIPGDNVASGQNLWVWDCAGREAAENQEFIFAEDSWRITSASDPSLCIDAGRDNRGSVSLMECNGQDEQVWGYDDDSKTIFLANSASDASQCLKVSGSGNSAMVIVAPCDDSDSAQQWSFDWKSASLQAVWNQTNAEWI